MKSAFSQQKESYPGNGLNIGQVLQSLSEEFGDISSSKLRFLEDQGLIHPRRTNSGYRKFSEADVERIRLILTLQRERYLPLKVIAELLAAHDADGENDFQSGSVGDECSALKTSIVLTRSELIEVTGASVELLFEGTSAGLLPASHVYDEGAITVVRALVQLQQHGIAPRHLRQLRAAAGREAELISSANESRGKPAGSAQASASTVQLAGLLSTVHSAVLLRVAQENSERAI